MPEELNVGCFRSRPQRERSRESSNSTRLQTTLPNEDLRGKRRRRRRGGGEGWRDWARRCHLKLSHSLRHQRPGPRCHVPASVHATPHPTLGRGHILPRPPGLLSCRGPWWAITRTRVAKGQLERLGQLSPNWPPRNPAPTRPSGASDSPGARLDPSGQASAPPARPGTLGCRPALQAHLQYVKSACSPPADRRLRSAGLARPAQPLSSAPLRSPELHSANLGARLLPDTSGFAWVSEAIL